MPSRDLPLFFALVLAGGVLIEKGWKGASGAFAPTGSSGAGSSAKAASGGTAVSVAGAPAKVGLMLAEAEALKGRPYVWGGGHSSSDWLNAAGYDCSGFVSAVLGSAGFLSGPQTTQTLPSQANIARGAGRWVTIYDRDSNADTSLDHVIIDIAGRWFESSSGGVQEIAKPTQSYLSTFNLILHPKGL